MSFMARAHGNVTMAWMAVFVLLLSTMGMAEKAPDREERPNRAALHEAIGIRSKVNLLAGEVAGMEEGTRTAMRRMISIAEGRVIAGDAFLKAERYKEAVRAYRDAEDYYRKAQDGRQLLEQVAEASRKVRRARTLAESVIEPEKTREARITLLNAEGYYEAGEYQQALNQYEEAGKVYEALISGGATATLEEAVGARTAMILERDLIRSVDTERSRRIYPAPHPDDGSLSQSGSNSQGEAEPKPGSKKDLIARAGKLSGLASEALQERDYSSAKALYSRAGNLYHEVVNLQARFDEIDRQQTQAEQAMNRAAEIFKTEARSPSYERGLQALSDGSEAYVQEDLDRARQFFTQAVTEFEKACGEAEKLNTLVAAHEEYIRQLAQVDTNCLNRYASETFTAIQQKAAEARTETEAGRYEKALVFYKEATAGLVSATSQALTNQNKEKALPILEKLETALTQKDKFAAEDILTELGQLVPSDERLPGLRERVNGLPGPRKELAIDLGGGVTLELVLVRPGKFQMGSDWGPEDEKPPHEVQISQPFYMGKYEVTQLQWEAVMGTNPSHFLGPSLPVEQVSWNDTQEFLGKLNEKLSGAGFRLPSEAEWEYACRAGSDADCLDQADCLNPLAWFANNAGEKTHAVGGKKPNTWGLFDIHGNVAEWCQDWYMEQFFKSPEASGTDIICTNDASGARVMRGGRWNEDAAGCRSTRRNGDNPERRCDDTGFRIVAPGSLSK